MLEILIDFLVEIFLWLVVETIWRKLPVWLSIPIFASPFVLIGWLIWGNG